MNHDGELNYDGTPQHVTRFGRSVVKPVPHWMTDQWSAVLEGDEAAVPPPFDPWQPRVDALVKWRLYEMYVEETDSYDWTPFLPSRGSHLAPPGVYIKYVGKLVEQDPAAAGGYTRDWVVEDKNGEQHVFLLNHLEKCAPAEYEATPATGEMVA